MLTSREAQIDTLMSDKANVRAWKTIGNQEVRYVMRNESIFQEDITIFNVYVSNKRVSKCMRHELIELQGERNEYSMTVGNFNTLPLESSRQPISKDRAQLKAPSVSWAEPTV